MFVILVICLGLGAVEVGTERGIDGLVASLVRKFLTDPGTFPQPTLPATREQELIG